MCGEMQELLCGIYRGLLHLSDRNHRPTLPLVPLCQFLGILYTILPTIH